MIWTNPNEYDDDVEPLVMIYQEAEDEIIAEIARLLAEEKNAGTMAWYINRLAQTKKLDAKVLKILASKSQMTEKAVKQAVFQALTKNAQRYASTIKRASDDGLFGRTTKGMTKEELLKRSNEIAERFKKDRLDEINRNAVESANSTYRRTIGQIFTDVRSKVKDFITSLVEKLRGIGEEGISGGTYLREGNVVVRTPIDTRVKREMVNQLVQESNRMMLEQCERDGFEYVEISAHMGARTGKKGFFPTIENPDPTNHAWWQGKVYKVHGEEKGYPNLVKTTGYGTITGLAGINCRHHIFPFIPNVSERSQPDIDEAENARIYELTQKQRYLEREVRKAKRVLETLKYSENEEAIKKARKTLNARYKALRDFLEDNKRDSTYIYRQPDRLKI